MSESGATPTAATAATEPRKPRLVGHLGKVLEDVPLHSLVNVHSLISAQGRFAYPKEITAHCQNEKCCGYRRHDYRSSDSFERGTTYYLFVAYKCVNCDKDEKVFGLRANISDGGSGTCTKIYQEPPYGEPIPKRLFHVIGEENREHFLQARRAIARGLGIGAYAYYRRIIENTKFDLVGSILEVARATHAPDAQIKQLAAAQKERQFSKAIELLRDAAAIPAILLIDGHNPLLFLHDLLSEGIHQLSDDECLERAREAEIILCEIANRMDLAVTEHKTVKAALTSILKRQTAAKTAT